MPSMLIDDFSWDDSKEPGSDQWDFITDQVMGGMSAGELAFTRFENRSCLHLRGTVSLENNGGFLQARRRLDPRSTYFNASSFDGIEVTAKGNGESYAVHLRTADILLPWQYYQAVFQTDGTWQTVKLPFKQFKPYALNKPLEVKKLKTVAIVAIKKAFEADIYLDQIGFYKEGTSLDEDMKPAS